MPLFDESDPETDLVIVSKSDQSMFYVYKAILCLASPVLKGKIHSLDRTSSDGSRPVLTLDETGPVLQSLLELCYPVSTPQFAGIQNLEPVLKAALGYSMGGISSRLRDVISTKFLHSPISVYACACRLRLEGEARTSYSMLAVSYQMQKPAHNSVPGSIWAKFHEMGSAVEWKVSRVYNDIMISSCMDDINAVDFIRLMRIPDNQAQAPVYSWTLDAVVPVTSELSDPFLPSFLGDVILRSTDCVEFHVCKAIVSFASPVFRDMFSLPQPTSHPPNTTSDLAVVSMTEHSSTLDLLLRVCYPLRNIPMKNTAVVGNALAAAMKYDMEVAAAYLKTILMGELGTTDPAGVFAVCCKLGFEKEAKEAAKLCLHLSLPSVESSQLWCLITASHYKRLRKYHLACGESASTAAKLQANKGTPSWCSSNLPWSTCTRPQCRGAPMNFMLPPSEIKPWWQSYMQETGRLLKATPLSSSAVSFDRLMPVATPPASATCDTCGPRLTQDLADMREFCKRLAAEVEKRVNNVVF